MALFTKDALLGASDLREREIELPSIGGSVRVRGLGAAYSNQATSEALKLITGPRGEQTATVDTAKLEILQVLHGLVEPKLDTFEEAERFMQQCGPAARTIVDVIDELSGVDKEAIEKTNATFQDRGPDPAGDDVGAIAAPARSGEPAVPVRAGA